MRVITISIVNIKGGTGKTTTTYNLGAALAARGKRVLLVDNDPQGSLTKSLGYDPKQMTVTLAARCLLYTSWRVWDLRRFRQSW